MEITLLIMENHGSVRVYAVIISKYVTKIVGTQIRQVACVHGTQDHMQLTFKNLSQLNSKDS